MPRQGAPAGKYLGWSCTVILVSYRFGAEPLRANVWVGRVRQGAPAGKCFGWSGIMRPSSLPGDCHASLAMTRRYECTAVSHRGQVFGLVVYGSEPLRASVLGGRV